MRVGWAWANLSDSATSTSCVQSNVVQTIYNQIVTCKSTFTHDERMIPESQGHFASHVLHFFRWIVHQLLIWIYMWRSEHIRLLLHTKSRMCYGRNHFDLCNSVQHAFKYISEQSLVLCTAIFDAVYRPILYNAKLLCRTAFKRLQSCNLTNPLVVSNKMPFEFRGIMDVIIALGTLSAWLRVFMINQLETDAILGGTFIETYVKAFLPQTRMVLFYKDPRIDIFARHTSKIVS